VPKVITVPILPLVPIVPVVPTVPVVPVVPIVPVHSADEMSRIKSYISMFASVENIYFVKRL